MKLGSGELIHFIITLCCIRSPHHCFWMAKRLRCSPCEKVRVDSAPIPCQSSQTRSEPKDTGDPTTSTGEESQEDWGTTSWACDSISYHSISQYIIPQYITVYHSISQYTTVYQSIPQYIMLNYSTLYRSIYCSWSLLLLALLPSSSPRADPEEVCGEGMCCPCSKEGGAQ